MVIEAAENVLKGGVSTVSFGKILLGSSRSVKLTIKNVGNEDLTDLSITNDGSNAGNFTVTALSTQTLSPGVSTSVDVTFTPDAITTYGADLHIASNDTDENPFDIKLTGNGITAPEIIVEQPTGAGLIDGSSTRNFSKVAVSKSSSPMSFLIRNTGTANLTGLGFSITGANPTDFTASALSSTTLRPGVDATFTVKFIPRAVGTRSASIHIASNDLDENPFDIKLEGTAFVLEPEIVVEQPAGSSLVDGNAKKSFGTVTVGKRSTAKSFTIRNTGTANLTGLAITKTGAHSSNFIVTAPAKTTLAPGASTTFSARFKPTAAGTRNAAIHIKSNDANENPFDIKLAGQGAAP